MGTRTMLGTASQKTSGATLTLASVAVTTNQGLLVGVGFDQAQGAPGVKWGNTSLSKVRQRLDATSGIGVAIYQKAQVWNGRTADVVATWGSAIGARALLAIEWTGPIIEDTGRNNIQTATGTVNSLLTGTPNYAGHFNWCIHASAGPSTDTPGTIEGTYGYTLGQRVGTTGGGLDVTIQESYAEFSTATDSRSRMTGATTRDWVSILCVLRGETQLQQGVTPADITAAQARFEALGLDTEDMVFAFNEAQDRWEVFNVTRSALPTLTAHSGDGWQ